ncbi:MAG TPA: hypothetical protein VM939_07725 [Gemmatimonadaceae bacterium]|nr:hypothetical protein [Gemmatimonadaceae bacterium]
MHPQTPHQRRTPRLLVPLAALLLAAPGLSEAQGNSKAPLSADLEAAKAALSKYKDPILAVKDGYLSTVACIDFPKGAKDGPIEYPPGAMGIHFVNMGNIGPNLDPAKPQVLIYEQVGDKLVLAAAEWFVPAAAAGATPPSIFGQTLAGPMDGHEPIMPASLRHYDLHVWLWKDNPRGVFTSTNAALKCKPKATYTVAIGEHH